MKKNMISIIILALLVVNIVMTVIMMFSIIPANKKTIALVDEISGAIKLDVAANDPEGAATGSSGSNVSLADSATYSIEDQQTFQLKKGEDGEAHYVVCKVAVLMNKTSEDYAAFGAEVESGARDPLILNAMSEVVGGYTYEDVEALGQTGLQEAALERIQATFGSDFIYQVALSGYIVQ
ncbi:MAG: flagellar basal body-associated FliL family protein [Lachnospiraceae bacterium]|nr:flagellar basal body-associated FliL family protein [Lachnospiraceae bacterium]